MRYLASYKTHELLPKASLILSLLILALFISLGGFDFPALQSQSTSLGSYVYSVKSSGVADVTVVIKGVTGDYDVYVHVDPGIIDGSITAFDSQGNMLPHK